MKNIKDIFYNHIIKEAAIGRINCLNYYNIVFETKIPEENLYVETDASDENIYVPTLIIKNKEEFDKLLMEYVYAAMEFYDDSNFDSDILSDKEYEVENAICKEKVILALLWSNATIEDFNNPVDFLKKRIEFIRGTKIDDSVGYSKILDSEIRLRIRKDNILNETPYMLEIRLQNGDDYYDLPQVKFGIFNNKLYIYAIQNKSKDITLYIKKIKRKLYKVNENFDGHLDNYGIYGDGNLQDITPSSLLSANIALFYLKRYGIDEVIIPSILIERWNAKKIALKVRCEKQKLPIEVIQEQFELQEQIQNNLTQKLIRTFLRLDYHHKSLTTTSYPMQLDSNIHLKLEDEVDCNNGLLEETASVVLHESKQR